MKYSMTRKHCRGGYGGFSLLELVIAIVIVMVLAVGGLSYLYHSNVGAKKAEVQATAARMASLLVHSWKGNGGSPTFNPVTAYETEFTITDSPSGPPAAIPDYAGTFTLLGNYHIVIDNVNYYAAMSYSPATASHPLVLSVCVAWRVNYAAGAISENDPSVRLSVYAIP